MFRVPQLALCVYLAGSPAWAQTISGRVSIEGASGRAASGVIVYAERLDGDSTIQTSTFALAQRKKLFSPRILAIPAGSRVDFPNQDLIFHNVFSLTRPETFDLGLYRAGDSKSHVFRQAGVYRVFCNIHPHMTAVVLVLPTSLIVEADSSGNFRMDLPAGRYRVTAWSERSEPSNVEVQVSSGSVSVDGLSLDESGFVETQHTNKNGRKYRRRAYSPTRGPS